MTVDTEKFRKETRKWLEGNCPESVRGPGFVPWGSRKIDLEPDTKIWLERMADKGWTVPTWPRQLGGADASREEYAIIQQEMRRINARPPLTGRGINYIGPTILEFGTDEQKQRWLPGMARGEGGWCMGYSEPAAGSDLANLQMKCVDEGDQFVLNGMKTWTSDGIWGDWIFCLVRTDPAAPKHEGISLVLVDMDQPGVIVRPIALINGKSPFCETFFDNAIAEKNNLIGGQNKGWGVGKRLLQYERSVHGGVNTSGSTDQETASNLADLARCYTSKSHIDENPCDKRALNAIRSRLIKLEMNSHAFRITQKRVIAETRARAPALATSILKVKGAEFTKERAECVQHVMGFKGIGWDGKEFNESEISANRHWLQSRAVSIYGGTSEIQLNIIAKRVLGLPD